MLSAIFSLFVGCFSSHEAESYIPLKVDRINFKFCSNLIKKKTIDTTKG